MTTTTSVDILDFIRVMENQITKCQQMNTLDDEYLNLLLENKEKYRDLCKQTEYLQRQMITMKRENSTLIKAQQRLETQLYAQDQELNCTKMQVATLSRRKKELETRLEVERQHYEADRLLWHQTEMELTSAIKKCSLENSNNRNNPRRTRSATASNIFHSPSLKVSNESRSQNEFCYHPPAYSPNLHAHTALVSGDQEHRQEFNLAKVQAQERLLASLTSELEKQKLSHLVSIQQQAEQLLAVKAELQGVKELNHTLMEDNEGYRMLLTEKTISGEFLKKSVEPEEHSTLATEINQTSLINESSLIQELSDEIKSLKESNKALQLYMNKILLKIIASNDDSIEVLNIDANVDRPESKKRPLPLDTLTKPKQQEQKEQKLQQRARRSTISTCLTSNHEKGWTKALKRMTVMGWSSGNIKNTPILEDEGSGDDARCKKDHETNVTVLNVV